MKTYMNTKQYRVALRSLVQGKCLRIDAILEALGGHRERAVLMASSIGYEVLHNEHGTYICDI